MCDDIEMLVSVFLMILGAFLLVGKISAECICLCL